MEGEAGTATDAVIREIADPASGWDFFHALRVLQWSRADLPPIGKAPIAAADAVRFGQHVSLAFPPTSLAGLGEPAHGGTPRVQLNCFGLLAPAGPFPTHFTRLIRQRERIHRDPAPARFLDIFNHRFATLLFRAWMVNNIAASYDRPEDSRFVDYVGSLCGYGSPALQAATIDEGTAARTSGPAGPAPGRDRVPLEAKLHFAGRLMCPSRHPEGLVGIIQSVLNVRARITEFLSRWIQVPVEHQTRFDSQQPMARLGQNTIVGERVFDCQSLFRLSIGPMPLSLYVRLLPGTPGMGYVRDWVRNYLGGQCDAQIQLVLDAREVPAAKLGGPATGGTLLGLTSWVYSGSSSPADRGDLIVEHCV